MGLEFRPLLACYGENNLTFITYQSATRAIESRAEKEKKLVRFFSSLELLRKGEKRDSEEGFESLEALPLSWLGGESIPLFFWFLFVNKKKGQCCRILLRWFREFSGGDIGVASLCALARSDKNALERTE
jgi:hypothetical protein